MDVRPVAMILTCAVVSAFMILWHAGLPDPHLMSGTVFAAEELKVDGLPSESRQFRAQVNQILAKVDSLIEKLKPDPKAQAMTLDLIQTRDDILREITKIESAPGDAKWTAQEMRESVQAKLKLLKDQYDKAVATAS